MVKLIPMIFLICLTGCATSKSINHVPLPILDAPTPQVFTREEAALLHEKLGLESAAQIAAKVGMLHEVYRARINRINEMIKKHNELHTEKKD